MPQRYIIPLKKVWKCSALTELFLKRNSTIGFRYEPNKFNICQLLSINHMVNYFSQTALTVIIISKGTVGNLKGKHERRHYLATFQEIHFQYQLKAPVASMGTLVFATYDNSNVLQTHLTKTSWRFAMCGVDCLCWIIPRQKKNHL